MNLVNDVAVRETLPLVKELKKFDFENDEDSILDIFKQLKKINMTNGCLKVTKVGIIVNKLSKKHKSEQVKAVGKEIISLWRKSSEIEKELEKKKSSSDNNNNNNNNNKDLVKKSKYIVGSTHDKMRNKVQEKLLEALETDIDKIDKIIVPKNEIVVRIEKGMFDRYKNTDKDYRAKYIELARNLKDHDNIDLNQRLFEGTIQPERLVKMSAIDMASGTLKALREKEKNDAIDAARSDYDKEMGATDMFKCGKCKQRKCTYFQKQTRSADEPMTTFVNCLNCGNRWKM